MLQTGMLDKCMLHTIQPLGAPRHVRPWPWGLSTPPLGPPMSSAASCSPTVCLYPAWPSAGLVLAPDASRSFTLRNASRAACLRRASACRVAALLAANSAALTWGAAAALRGATPGGPSCQAPSSPYWGELASSAAAIAAAAAAACSSATRFASIAAVASSAAR